MSQFEIVLASVIILGVIAQIVILVRIQQSFRRMSSNADRALGTLEPKLQEFSETLRTARESLDSWKPEVTATLSAVRATTESLGDLTRRESREVAQLIEKTTAMAERQISETDRSLDVTRERIALLLDNVDRNLLEPVRVVLAVSAGVRRGVERLTRSGSSDSS
ncbi:MAG: hypothetical protein GF346_11840 [Candidatus Eisenbacteria bacterium]|nr:hypothetical protein [Candidatus Latescibacterota bacterium]MBD3303128.1 hypothetical protein [Candidatus Eisenbacteria bacterium]